MPHVTETARIPMNADALWHEMGADGADGAWRPQWEQADSEGDRAGDRAGATRTAHGADGSTQVERLRAFDVVDAVRRFEGWVLTRRV